MQKKHSISQFLIAAPSSGSGKTTFSLGLMRALARQGKHVQPFKCGPDYIDTMHHAVAAGRASVNLDTFLASEKHVAEIFATYREGADVAIVEGVMGLFDGAKKMAGSSAEIAELLDLPIVLIVNAKATAYSIAPLLFGFKNFYARIRIAGVVFNNVNTASHYNILKEAAEDVGIEPLGYVPNNETIQLQSRHLGLTIERGDHISAKIDAIANHIEQHIDIAGLLRSTECGRECSVSRSESNNRTSITVAVAKDDAFNFAYAANIDALQNYAELVYFSPLRDSELPVADLVYFAGGYPECFLEELSANRSMKNAVFEFYEKGGNILAECGGMMYLSRSVADKDGTVYPMVGVLAQDATMQNMKLTLGYRTLCINGREFRGHEFHYSQIINSIEHNSAEQVLTARNVAVATPFYAKKNLRASYIHLYWADRCKEFFNAMFNELI